MCARSHAVEYVADEVRHILLNPESVLLDQSKWPDKPPEAKANVGSEEDYHHIVSEMYSRDLMGGIVADDVFKDHNGVGVFNGALGFGKKGKPLEGEVRCTRFILSMVPSTAYQRAITGDCATLSPSPGWVMI